MEILLMRDDIQFQERVLNFPSPLVTMGAWEIHCKGFVTNSYALVSLALVGASYYPIWKFNNESRQLKSGCWFK